MRYAFTPQRFVCKLGRRKKDGYVECSIVRWSVKKRNFVYSEIEEHHEDNLELIPGSEVREALAVERRDAESVADAEAESFLDDLIPEPENHGRRIRKDKRTEAHDQ